MARDHLVCRCIIVSEREVLRAIRSGARSVEAVGDRCEAGTGCGSCHAIIEHLLQGEAARVARKTRRQGTTAQVGLFGAAGIDE
jgi:bacterioferritin-associated ferredoxin